MKRPHRIGDSIAEIITRLEAQWTTEPVCPCCGRTWAEIVAAGEVEIYISRSLRRSLRRQGRSRGTARRPR